MAVREQDAPLDLVSIYSFKLINTNKLDTVTGTGETHTARKQPTTILFQYTSAAPDKGLKVGLLDCDMTVENRCGEAYRCGEMYRCDRSKFASGSGSETGRNPALYSSNLQFWLGATFTVCTNL